MDANRLMTTLELALGASLDDDAFDVLIGVDPDAPDAIEVTTDTWTLIIEGWPLGDAFIALDAEPDTDDEGEQNVALRTALGGSIAALASVDDACDGALAAALRASNDPLSARLAVLIDELP